MPLPYPDKLIHNNPNLPLIRDDQVQGSAKSFDSFNDIKAIPEAKRSLQFSASYFEREGGTANPVGVVNVKYFGATTTDADWFLDTNWEVFQSTVNNKNVAYVNPRTILTVPMLGRKDRPYKSMTDAWNAIGGNFGIIVLQAAYYVNPTWTMHKPASGTSIIFIYAEPGVVLENPKFNFQEVSVNLDLSNAYLYHTASFDCITLDGVGRYNLVFGVLELGTWYSFLKTINTPMGLALSDSIITIRDLVTNNGIPSATVFDFDIVRASISIEQSSALTSLIKVSGFYNLALFIKRIKTSAGAIFTASSAADYNRLHIKVESAPSGSLDFVDIGGKLQYCHLEYFTLGTCSMTFHEMDAGNNPMIINGESDQLLLRVDGDNVKMQFSKLKLNRQLSYDPIRIEAENCEFIVFEYAVTAASPSSSMYLVITTSENNLVRIYQLLTNVDQDFHSDGSNQIIELGRVTHENIRTTTGVTLVRI